jgi:predicted nucleic acid-binding protein
MKACYLDSSALLRILFQEKGHEKLSSELMKMDRIVSSRLLYVEAHRALVKVGLLEGEGARIRLNSDLNKMIEKMDLLEMSKLICEKAASIQPQRNIRSLDSIHAASFFWFMERDPKIKFFCFDTRLLEAVSEPAEH